MKDSLPKKIKPQFLSVRFLSVKKLWLFLLFIFCLIVIGSFLLLPSGQNFFELAPVDTIFYFNARNSGWFSSKNNKTRINDLPFDNFYNQVDEIFGWPSGTFSNKVLAKVSQASFLLYPQETGGSLAMVFIVETRDASALKILFELPNSLKLKENVVAFSPSTQALEKLSAVFENKLFSLPFKAGLLRLTGGFLTGYLDIENAKKYLDQNNLSSSIFDANFEGDWHFSLDSFENGWQFKVDTGKNFNYQKRSNQLISYLPSNFLVFVSQTSLLDIFSIWSAVDSEYESAFKQAKAALSSIYNFDFKELEGFFNQPLDLVVLPTSTESIWGLDFILALPPASADRLGKLEKLINIVLAQAQPVEKNKILADGSLVTEVIAEPNSFIWQSKELAGGFEIRYLDETIDSYPKPIPFQLGYLATADQLVFSSSINWLEQFAAIKDIDVSQLLNYCPIKGKGQAIALNLANANAEKQPWLGYLPVGPIIVKKFSSTGFSGCILDF